MSYRFHQEVFIGGAPKSGTTLMLSLLDQTPGLLVLPEEVALFNRILPQTGGKDYAEMCRFATTGTEFARLQATAPPPPEAGSIRENRPDYSGFDFNAFRERLSKPTEDKGSLPATFLHSLAQAYAATADLPQGDYTLVEKTPANDYNWRALRRFFPQARLLQVIRDPRDVYASRVIRLLQTRPAHSKAFRLVNEWNRSVAVGKHYEQQPNRWLAVRYEDLVQDTDATLQRVARFLGIPGDSIPRQPTRGGQAWAGNSSGAADFKGISSQSIGRWQKTLSDRELWWVEHHCAAGMRQYGYATSLSSKELKACRHWWKKAGRESNWGYLKARRGSLCWKWAPQYMMRGDA